MNDVYGTKMNLFRVHEEPYTGRAKQGAKSNRVRMTGMSFESIKANIREKKIQKKVDKYNEEYQRLFDLAIDVDKARVAAEEGKSDYSVVKENIEMYNRQARRLAEIGVQVLMPNSAIQKISFGEEKSPKALKVPGFLIGPLRMFSKAGRQQAAAEKEARLEKERAIEEAIVATAEAAVGQLESDEVNEDKLDQLQHANLSSTVVSKLTEPEVDEEAKKKAAAEEIARVEKEGEEIREAEVARIQAEEAKAKEAEDAKAKLAKLKASGDDALKKNYGKAKGAGHEGVKKAQAAVAKADAFDVLKSVNDIYGVVKIKEKNAELLGIKKDEKTKLIVPSQFGAVMSEAMGQELAAEDVKTMYMNTLDMAKLARAWRKIATREVVSEEGVRVIDAFDEENRAVFNYVVAAVERGASADEMKAQAETELSEEEAKIVAQVAEQYDLVVPSIKILKANLVEREEVKVEVESKESEVSVDKTEMYKVGNAKLAELALALYGKKSEVVAEKKDEKPKVGLSFVDQIGVLVSEIEALTANRDKLRGLLGDEASETLEGLERSINERLAKINELASGSIVSLGKDGSKKEEVVNPVVEEKDDISKKLKEEAEAVVDNPVVVPVVEIKKKKAEQEEMKVEEKAEIDTRVVTGAHVHVDARPENFSPDNRYAAAKRDPYISFLNGNLTAEEEETMANRGILTDAEKEAAVDWWKRIGATILDTEDYKKLSDSKLDASERERIGRKIDSKVFEVNRDMRAEEDKERRRQQTARLQLKHCKPLEGYDIDEFIATNGQNVVEADRFDSPYGLVRYMEKHAPQMYGEMMAGYNESMAAKQAELMEKGHSFSDSSVEKFSKR